MVQEKVAGWDTCYERYVWRFLASWKYLLVQESSASRMTHLSCVPLKTSDSLICGSIKVCGRQSVGWTARVEKWHLKKWGVAGYGREILSVPEDRSRRTWGWVKNEQHWRTQGSKEKTDGECDAFEDALCSSGLGWGPTKPFYPEETVLSAETWCAENSIIIYNCVNECCGGPGVRSANRLIGEGKVEDLSAPRGAYLYDRLTGT